MPLAASATVTRWPRRSRTVAPLSAVLSAGPVRVGGGLAGGGIVVSLDSCPRGWRLPSGARSTWWTRRWAVRWAGHPAGLRRRPPRRPA
jgi:hypothetical protein